MHKRSIIMTVLIVAAAVGALIYSAQRRMQKGTQPTPPPMNHAVVKRPAETPKVSPMPQTGYSAAEHDLLRQRYEPRPPAAKGPLEGPVLALAVKTMQEDLQEKESWPLVKAALTGDVTALRNALDTGVTANTTVFLYPPYNANVPLLDFAILGGQRDAVKLLLDHGASVSPVEYGTPFGGPFRTVAPLPYAAQFDEDDVVQLLIDHGADIEQKNDFGSNNSTALNAAVVGASPSTVYLLLSNGANINSALAPDGTVPQYLINADASPNQVAVRQLLIEHGARMPPGK